VLHANIIKSIVFAPSKLCPTGHIH